MLSRSTGVRTDDPALPVPGLLGSSPALRQLMERVRRVAATDATVLISGESGTGKEMVAQTLHALSPRAAGPFVPVNCGAIAPTLIEAQLLGHEKGSFTGADRERVGYFESAQGGTIFLDEITEVPPEMQVKLLRVLESRRFQRVGGSRTLETDVRVIASTNRDVAAAVAEGVFREDLFYRLAVFPLRLPPLRERERDALELAQHFLDDLNRRESTAKTFSRHALQQIGMHPWPGNVRELKNAIGRAYILSDAVIEAGSLVPVPSPTGVVDPSGRVEIPVGSSLASAHRALILATVDRLEGDKAAAAQALGISLKTLYGRLEQYRRG